MRNILAGIAIILGLAIGYMAWFDSGAQAPKSARVAVFGRTLCDLCPWLCHDNPPSTPVHPKMLPEPQSQPTRVAWNGQKIMNRRIDPATLSMVW